jgi:SAM-dependent methyltransferase
MPKESLNNQTTYWDKVAHIKTFTHPVDWHWIKKYIPIDSAILDFGCGYGRIVNEFHEAGYTNIKGVDTSKELIKRGLAAHPYLHLSTIDSPDDISAPSFDLITLFAVLTCIPENNAQSNLISHLKNILSDDGILYISDYYLQDEQAEAKKYTTLNDDPNNFGVFTLPEEVTFRHHTHQWVAELSKEFNIVMHKIIEVRTMNGHRGEAFQTMFKKK